MVMARPRRYTCIVCGRSFPEGQGIRLDVAGELLYFHSNKCFSKFFRVVLEYSDDSCLRPAIREAISEFNRINEAKIKSRRKVI